MLTNKPPYSYPDTLTTWISLIIKNSLVRLWNTLKFGSLGISHRYKILICLCFFLCNVPCQTLNTDVFITDVIVSYYSHISSLSMGSTVSAMHSCYHTVPIVGFLGTHDYLDQWADLSFQDICLSRKTSFFLIFFKANPSFTNSNTNTVQEPRT